jgi:hypothetical protein
MTTYGQGASGKANAYGGFANNVNQFGSSGAGVAGSIGQGIGAGSDWLSTLGKSNSSSGSINTDDPNKDWLG